MPALNALYRDHLADGLVVIGVTMDEATGNGAGASLQAPIEASFPVVADSSESLSSLFVVSWVPCSFVLDRQGTVRWVGSDPSLLRRAVEVVLAE
jgi:hypothetical protein